MTYDDATTWLNNLTNHEKYGFKSKFADAVNLRSITRLAELLGDPQKKLRAVHIAGTKGKGSVAATVESIARAAGYSTGLFTSPHLVTPRERIRVNGEMLSNEELISLVETVKPAVEQLAREGLVTASSFFEVYTAMAFVHFAARGVELAVIETGLGGRLDATNICEPVLCAVTTLGLDHTEILGDTIEKIAAEKAGIIKPEVPVVVAPNPPEALEVIHKIAAEKSAEIVEPPLAESVVHERLRMPAEGEPIPSVSQTVRIVESEHGEYLLNYSLAGRHQAGNLGMAVGISRALSTLGFGCIDSKSIEKGARELVWPGRLEVVSIRPWVVLDCAHNPQSAKALAESLPSLLEYDRLVTVVGVSSEKDAAGVASALAYITDVAVLTRAHIPRSMAVDNLESKTGNIWKDYRTAATVAEAVDVAVCTAGPGGCVLVTGSFFVIDDYLHAVGAPAE